MTIREALEHSLKTGTPFIYDNKFGGQWKVWATSEKDVLMDLLSHEKEGCPDGAIERDWSMLISWQLEVVDYFEAPKFAAPREQTEYVAAGAAPANTRYCACDFHTVLLRTGCVCGGA